jgi:anaerobic C4-dicarboxylate transporter
MSSSSTDTKRDSADVASAKLRDQVSGVDPEPLNMKDWSTVSVFALTVIMIAFLALMWAMTKLSKDPKTLETTKNVVMIAVLVYFLIITIWYLAYGIVRYDRKLNKEGIFIP